jgi:hypothetical protein
MTQAAKPPSGKSHGSRANRRSKRLPAAHRMLLTITNASGSEIAKEIVSTVEISQHGARVRGRRLFRPDAEGLLTQLSSGRQARVRVAWQRPAQAQAGYLDSGVELLNGFDYWGVSFVDPPPTEVAAEMKDAAQKEPAVGSVVAQANTAQELLEALAAESGDRPRVLEAAWCALVEQLEARQSLSRADLIAAIRSLAPDGRGNAQGQNPKSKK